jgi:AraC-like DNA-binding protein
MHSPPNSAPATSSPLPQSRMKGSIDIAEVLPDTIRRTSDHLNFPSARVLVRELPSVGVAQTPSAIDYFWLSYRPPEEPGRMVAEYKSSNLIHVADRSLLFVSPGTRFTCRWSGGEGAVMHIQFRSAFLEEVALLSRVDAERLYQSAIQEVPLNELLAGLCRVLMREVQGGCRHGLPFFEAISRAMAFALVQSLGSPCAESARDERIAKAVRFIEQHFQERVSLPEIARAACLSPYYFLRLFRTVVGISPHAYLVQCRLRHARRLLAAGPGNRTLTHVAVEAGFYDQTHLTRHFRCAFGKTPGDWLRQQKSPTIEQSFPIRTPLFSQ